jgi:hypothetical protein
MSLDYTCYSLERRPLSPRRIAESAGSWQFEFQSDKGPLPTNRALPAFCLVWICRHSSKMDLRSLLRANDLDALDSLSRRNRVGCCELETTADFVADEEIIGDLPARAAKALSAACTRFDTRSSAGQNRLTWLGQSALCLAIARVAGGLIEDPQLGRFRIVKPPA